MLFNVPPEETKGRIVSAHVETGDGEIVNTLGVGLTLTVIVAVVAHGVAPVV
jgi:hypothetical protein